MNVSCGAKYYNENIIEKQNLTIITETYINYCMVHLNSLCFKIMI